MLQKAVLREFIESEFSGTLTTGKLGDQDSLLENGIIDSMSIVQLLVFIQDRFEIEVADDELVPENFETIDAISRLIRSKASNLPN